MRDWSTKLPSNNNDAPRLSDLVPIVNLKDGKTRTLRLIGPMTLVPIVWIEIKKKEGGKARIPRISLRYDPKTGETNDKIECPYEAAFGAARATALSNAIDRDLQEGRPAKPKKPTAYESKTRTWFEYEAMYKENNEGGGWTPVEVLQVPISVARKIQDIIATNKKKIKDKKGNTTTKNFGPDHPKYGFDITIKYDGKRSPAEQYFVAKSDSSPLTEEELEYLLWQYNLEKPFTMKEALEDVKKLKKIAVSTSKDADDEDDEDDEDEDDKVSTKKSKSKKSSKAKSFDDDDDDDADDEDEDEPPKKSKKKSKSFDDDDDDDDEDEEDEKPKKKSKKKPVDEDEDDEDEEDEKSKKKSKAKSKSDDEDDEDEDEPPKKSKKKKASKDDDDWDDD